MTTNAAATQRTKYFDKGFSLDELERELANYEKGKGPIKALGRTTAKTAATFTLGPRPTPLVELVTGTGAPDGYDLVCSGGVWILNNPQDISAVRKRPD
jgi:hypothetical protein